MYFVGGYDGMLDEIFTNGSWVNEINSGLFSLGFRLYPFGSGLVFGADAGVSQLDGFTAWGYGFGGTAAWDLSSIGLDLAVGLRAVYYSFEYSSPSFMFAAMPFVAVLMK